MAVKILFIILSLCDISFVYAQQVTQTELADPAFLQRTITNLSMQRNEAQDSVAVVQARLSAITIELTKAKARIEELEKKDAKQVTSPSQNDGGSGTQP